MTEPTDRITDAGNPQPPGSGKPRGRTHRGRWSTLTCCLRPDYDLPEGDTVVGDDTPATCRGVVHQTVVIEFDCYRKLSQRDVDHLWGRRGGDMSCEDADGDGLYLRYVKAVRQ